jgi:hypothetical protein
VAEGDQGQGKKWVTSGVCGGGKKDSEVSKPDTAGAKDLKGEMRVAAASN